MGWLTFNWTGTAKQYFEEMYQKETNFEIVDIAVVGFRVAYIAARNKTTGHIICHVNLLHRAPKSYYNFGYKDMSEFSGPNVVTCPKRILDKLTPMDILEKSGEYGESSIEWATAWRKGCYEYVAKTVKSGSIIKLENPVSFTSGHSYQYFKKVGRRLYAIGNYGTSDSYETPVRFSGLKHQTFEVIK